ncbi:MAG TPA: flagellar hook-length control protein FliK, partial [Steroidobacter sp.]|nr:flagellar hook-length control protein FliK [Steroidobacter sp.]
APASSAAPSSVSVDFGSMLGQLAGAVAPTPASTAMQAALPVTQDSDELDTDAESTDMLGMMPLSLPVMPTDVQGDVNAQAATLLGVAAAGVSKDKNAVAREAQLLSDLIEPEQTSGQGKFEIPQLPSNDVSPLRQAESHARAVNVPVGSEQWADEIGSRMTMMVEQGKHTASLRLSPEHLGPLEVRITMNGDQASVQFGAAHVDTRNALESALPRLREMFASQGLSLADANVSREPPRQQQNPTPQSLSSSSGIGGEEGVTSVSAAQVRLGLLDAYA